MFGEKVQLFSPLHEPNLDLTGEAANPPSRYEFRTDCWPKFTSLPLLPIFDCRLQIENRTLLVIGFQQL
jgi:hypothetical protein